eukprot:TRINITY_DN4018_c0_g9_i1.p1 TRINITY_DN4018_c0_g9~~TRINITY_DN4018_c0_g9_i1.p1  ORF type:complete len:1154 (+),score=430.32 TRINITY_DN4018_c0_g9_i1:483-3464(+)
MDPTYMESVWWVFSQLHKKGLVYRGFKVMPYSTGCSTPLSNFESNLNYKDVSDPEVICTMPLVDQPDTSLLIWTTTPWTLPSNLAVCVNPEMVYLTVKDVATGNKYILAESRLTILYKPKKGETKPNEELFEVLSKCKGNDLKGKKYTPLFDFFVDQVKDVPAFTVLADSYVTDSSGTGCVHCAPAFGEDDYRVCAAAGIVKKGQDIVCPVDASGFFTAEVGPYAKMHVKGGDADKQITKDLKGRKRCILSGSFRHSYPFCWRSETPLIYKAVPSWFVNVEKVRDQLVENNKKSYWVPTNVQEKRFNNWLEEARDWAVSRNRFWGTPLPLWVSDDYEEIVCVGSVEELYELSGVRVTDLHREFVDKITIPSKMGKGELHRTDEVFDCWFESGSMPYGQIHYPFENKEGFEKKFPADFIAEGVDQTRGWFYTLLILSTCLFEKPAFKNLVVNGLVLAADGKKMSKRLKNYPDPMLVVNKIGADPLRMYLINSPVVRGETLRFEEAGVKKCVTEVMLPWHNAYRFFVTSALLYAETNGQDFVHSQERAAAATNLLDRWILSKTQSLVEYVRQEMGLYHLYTVIPELVAFIDYLTNWYVRFNRTRLKGVEGPEEALTAMCVLCEVLVTLSKLMSPFTPYIAEAIYLNLRNVLPEADRSESVHFTSFPEANESLRDAELESTYELFIATVTQGRVIRDRAKINLKTPVTEVMVVCRDEKKLEHLKTLELYIKNELNTRTVQYLPKADFCQTQLQVDGRKIGKRVGKAMKEIQKTVTSMDNDAVQAFLAKGEMEIAGHVIKVDECNQNVVFSGAKETLMGSTSGDILIVMDVEPDESLENEGIARDFTQRIQRMRKEVGVVVTDPIEVYYTVEGKLAKIVADHMDNVRSTIRRPVLPMARRPPHAQSLGTSSATIGKDKYTLEVTRPALAFDHAAVTAAVGGDKTVASNFIYAASVIGSYTENKATLEKDNKLELSLDGKTVTLNLGKEVFLTAADQK